jgi:hypothetical protein
MRCVASIAVGALVVILAAHASASVIDMEGIAPIAGQSTQQNATHAYGDFSLTVPYGHFFDSANPEIGPSRPDNGSDWLMNDWVPPFVPGLTIAKNDGGRFSAISFDATEWDPSFSSGTTIRATGHLFGGGTTTQQFSTDSSLLSFETFTLDGSFVDLVKLELMDSGRSPPPMHEEGALAYDNIVLATVPEPGLGFVVLSALCAVSYTGRRKSSNGRF